MKRLFFKQRIPKELGLLLLVVVVLSHKAGASLTSSSSRRRRHLYTDSFGDDNNENNYGSNAGSASAGEEYDFNILDPHHAYGAPYGGFSRATKTRLASLPLYLPDIVVVPASATAAASEEEEQQQVEQELSSSSSTSSTPEGQDGTAEDQQHRYMQVRDETGRLFACRVYDEDELDPTSLNESMFDAPILRQKRKNKSGSADDDQKITTKNNVGGSESNNKLATTTTTQQQQQSSSSYSPRTRAVPQQPKKSEESHASGSTPNLAPSGSQHGLSNGGGSSSKKTTDPDASMTNPAGSSSLSGGGENSVSIGADGSITTADKKPTKSVSNTKKTHDVDVSGKGEEDTTGKDGTMTALAIEQRLQELVGICGQVHKGWWSYEWCFQQQITQFHIEYDSINNQVKVESVTELGDFQSRWVEIDLQTPNEWAEDTPELARVVDKHDDGAICPETNKPRSSYVHMQCCSEKVMNKRKGFIHKDGRQVASDVAALVDVYEDPNSVCTYNVTVCTPLLCGADEEEEEEGVQDDDASSVVDSATDALKLLENILTQSSNVDTASANENESIRDILDRTLSKLCLQTNTGWWTYEICHKQSIRQFHEIAGMGRNSAGAKFTSKVVEAEHILGNYDTEVAEQVSDEEEWKLVVNATDEKSWGEGNGAYYEVEYTGGDICDNSDVTDSAIVAGVTRVGGLERASSVRYFCGRNYDIQVNEDHTCHYVVEVKVPELCRHPLFRAPVAKKRVIKCLPVLEK